MTLLKEEVSYLVKPLRIHTGGKRQIYVKQPDLGLDGLVNGHEWSLRMEVFVFIWPLCIRRWSYPTKPKWKRPPKMFYFISF